MSRLHTCREGLLILGFLLSSSFVSGCAEPKAPSAPPVEDDFSDCLGWPTDTDEFVSLSCTDGAYRVLIKKSSPPQNARIFFTKSVKRLSVETDATRRAGSGRLGYGVSCWTSRGQGYLFLISPGGAWGIEKVTGAKFPPAPLAESPSKNAIPGLRDTNRIRGVCVGGGQAPTSLVLYVNGTKIATTEDGDGSRPFLGYGLFVFSAEGGADVRFDNFAAR
jgi:hypothetical protein